MMHYKDAIFLTPTSWKHSEREELRRFSKELCTAGRERLKQSWKNFLIMKENVRKNKLDFVNDVPMIDVKLI